MAKPPNESRNVGSANEAEPNFSFWRVDVVKLAW